MSSCARAAASGLYPGLTAVVSVHSALPEELDVLLELVEVVLAVVVVGKL